MSAMLFVLAIVIFCVYWSLPFFTGIYNDLRMYKKLKNVPGPKAKLFTGNIDLFYSPNKPISAVVFDLQKNLCKQFSKHGIFRLIFGIKPEIYLFKPEIIETILSNSIMIEKTADYKMLGKWLGNGLLTSTSTKWRSRRKILTPIFHFKLLEEYIPIINEYSLILCQRLGMKADEEDVCPYVTSATLDVILETAMGVKLNCQTSDVELPYVKALKRFGELFTTWSITPWMWIDFLFRLSPSGKEFYSSIKVLHELTTSVISKRRNYRQGDGNKKHIDGEFNKRNRKLAFIDLLLDQFPDDDEAVREEVDTFMFGGHDTTGVALTYALFLIGHHPTVQERIFEELDEVLEGDMDIPITMDHVRRLNYLAMVIRESLRMFPPAALIARKISQSVKIGDFELPAGCDVILNFIGLHYNEDVYPDPETFDPERFNMENSSKRHPFAYCPFSAGARSCIGQKFALMEEKIFLANILKQFKIESLTPMRNLEVSLGIVLRPSCDVKIRFLRR